MSENWKLIESEKSDLINSLESILEHLQKVLKEYRKLEFNDDRDVIYLRGYVGAINDIVNVLDMYQTVINNKRSDEK
jgi:hypothetical protein